SLLAPLLDVPAAVFQAAIDDFSQTLQRRLDQTWQALAFIQLAEDERAGSALGAPVCYRDYCTPGMLTLERVEGLTVADALGPGAADDADAAAGWIVGAATRGEGGEPEDALLRRFRQVVPFRDGEWSGEDRFAEQLLAQWRATTQSRWHLQAHQLHLYRGVQA